MSSEASRTFRLSGGTTITSNVPGFDPDDAMKRLRALPMDLVENILAGGMEVEEAERIAKERLDLATPTEAPGAGDE